MVVKEFEVDEVIEACRIVNPTVFISAKKTDRVVGNYYQNLLE